VIARLFAPLWGNAWLLLGCTAMFWAGNAIIGRALVGHVPPATLSFIRWFGAFAIVLGFAWPHLCRDRAVLLQSWRMMLLLSLTGIACFNVALYIGLNSTTALNGVLMQSSQPLIVILWAAMLGTEQPTLRRILGIVVSFIGVAVIVTKGSLGAIATLEVNRGDLWVLGGSLIYGLYIAILRWRPDVHPLSFLASTFGIGMLMVMPLMLNEQMQGLGISTAPLPWLGILYIMIFPSLIAYLCFNRGVELAGPGTAGQATHLVPVFGTLLAIMVLGERFHIFHAAGIALIAAGILLATRQPRSSPR
jgi:drug/metabolite transporter (DMT)-like permease